MNKTKEFVLPGEEYPYLCSKVYVYNLQKKRYTYTCTINCSSRLLQKFKLWTPVLNLLFNSMLFLSQFCRCFGALGYHTTCRSGRQMRILFPSLSCPRNTRKVQKKEIILNKNYSKQEDEWTLWPFIQGLQLKNCQKCNQWNKSKKLTISQVRPWLN